MARETYRMLSTNFQSWLKGPYEKHVVLHDLCLTVDEVDGDVVDQMCEHGTTESVDFKLDLQFATFLMNPSSVCRSSGTLYLLPNVPCVQNAMEFC